MGDDSSELRLLDAENIQVNARQVSVLRNVLYLLLLC